MKLKEIVEEHEYPNITFRQYSPYGEDIIVGYGSYKNGELTSLDGNEHSLDEEVIEHYFDERRNELFVRVRSH